LQDAEKKSIFAFFWKKRPLLENFQTSVPKGLIATPIDVLCSNFVKFSRRKIGKIVRCLPAKKKQNFASLSTVTTARTALKISQGHPPTMYSECFRFHPNRFTFGGVVSHRMNTVRALSKVNQIIRLKPRFKPNKNAANV